MTLSQRTLTDRVGATILGGGRVSYMPDTAWMNELFCLRPTGVQNADIEKGKNNQLKEKDNSRQSTY